MTVKLVTCLKVVNTQCGEAGWWEAWIYKYVYAESRCKLPFNRVPHKAPRRDHVLVAAASGIAQHRERTVLKAQTRKRQKTNSKRIHTCIHIHTYIHKHIHIYIHTCIHTYKHIHTHTYIHTYKLTNSMEQCRVQKSITVPQTAKKFLAFCESRGFNIVFTRVRLFPLSWDRSIQSRYSHSIIWDVFSYSPLI